MRWIIAHKALGRDHGGRVIHRPVLGVDQVQGGLFREIAVGKTGFQLLELVNGGQIVL